MAKRKWFQLFDEDHNALSNAASVWLDVEDVDALQIAVEKMYASSHL